MNVLVLAAHPDDEVLGCGASIAQHVDEGDRVRIVIVTIGDPARYSEEEVRRTRAELDAAHKILGSHEVRYLDFPAPNLDTVPGADLADAIRCQVREFQPDVVYCPHRGDIHGDHKAVYWASLVACRPTPDICVARLLSYETLSETEWAAPYGDDAFIPTIYVDISKHLERKLLAMACYYGQVKASPHSRSLEAIEALARLRGAHICRPAAEAFMLVREIR